METAVIVITIQVFGILLFFILLIRESVPDYLKEHPDHYDSNPSTLDNETYDALREIYHNPEMRHSLSRHTLKKYINLLIQSVPPFDPNSYSEMVALLSTAKRIRKQDLVRLWEISPNNRIIREAISQNPKLPEELRALYALELLSQE